jgi:hypothetical protein
VGVVVHAAVFGEATLGSERCGVAFGRERYRSDQTRLT